ncbi:hypothetical protein ACFX13_028705 [Malus domestica]
MHKFEADSRAQELSVKPTTQLLRPIHCLHQTSNCGRLLPFLPEGFEMPVSPCLFTQWRNYRKPTRRASGSRFETVKARKQKQWRFPTGEWGHCNYYSLILRPCSLQTQKMKRDHCDSCATVTARQNNFKPEYSTSPPTKTQLRMWRDLTALP